MGWLLDSEYGAIVLGAICFVGALIFFGVCLCLICSFCCGKEDRNRHVKRRRVTPDPSPPPIIWNKPVVTMTTIEEGTQTTEPPKEAPKTTKWSVPRERLIRTEMKENPPNAYPEPFGIQGVWAQSKAEGIPYDKWVRSNSPMQKPDTPDESVFQTGPRPIQTSMSLRSGPLPSMPPSTAPSRRLDRLFKG